MFEWLNQKDLHISGWMDKYCQFFMRMSLAVIFLWFGWLKLLGISPEIELIRRTVYWFPPDFFMVILGWWEVSIGLGLLIRPLIRVALLLLFALLPGTLLPLFILPENCFNTVPFGLTLEGQYIIKNLFILSAAFVVGSKVRYQSEEGRLL